MTNKSIDQIRIATKRLGLTAVIALAMIVEAAAGHASGEYGALTPTNIRFIQFSVWPGEQSAIAGSYGYAFGGGFRVELERLDTRTAAVGYAHPIPVGKAMVDASESLFGSGTRVTAYQLRAGSASGTTRTLFGSLAYRWTNGSMPYLSVAGIPAKVSVRRHGVVVGVNYHF